MSKRKGKVLCILLFVLLSMCMFNKSYASTEKEDNLIYKIAPDGKTATFKTIKPTDEIKAELYLTNVVNVLLNEEDYRAYVDCDDINSCIVTITNNDWDESGFKKSYNINITYDEPEKNEFVDSIVNKIKDFNELKEETYYQITDLNLINYYMTSVKSDLWRVGATGKAFKYSEDIIKLSDGGNISFYLHPWAGQIGDESMYENTFGELSIFYDDYNYAVKHHGLHFKKVIYIPQDTPDTKENYILAAQKRINDYLGTNDVKVTYGGLLDSLLDKYCEDPLVPREITDGNYYNITIKGRTYKFYILKGTEQELKKPTYSGKHIETNVKITTDESTVPLDTHLTVETIKNDNIKQILGTENYQAFDIKLFSDSKNDWITRLESGKFLVSIPVKEELNGKIITTYYINNNNKVEEYKTVVKDKIASFETDHFSTYVLAEKIENNPNQEQENNQTTEQKPTKDNEKHILDDEPKTGVINIVTYVTLFFSISIVGIIVCKRKMYR